MTIKEVFLEKIVNNFLYQSILFQQQMGVDEIFDFTTGRDFYFSQQSGENIKSLSHQKDNFEKIEDKQQDEVVDGKVNNDVDCNVAEDKKLEENIDVDNFEDLVSAIKNFNGCDLKRHSSHDVIYDGNKEADIFILGEAPGEDEDLQGVPFVGNAGKLLRRAISFIKLDVSNVFITNTIFWRPPMNRTPSDDEVRSCFPFLKKMIEIVDPKIIITCGTTATNTILHTNEKISKLIGSAKEITFLNTIKQQEKKITVFPVYHPSYLLRSPKTKKVLWEHLLKIQDILRELRITND